MQMPRIVQVLALGLALACAAGPSRAATVEEGASAAFAKFKQALADRDGAAAARYADDRSLDFYERVRRAALKMQKDQLLKQSLFFQGEVLAARVRYNKSEIERAEGREIFAKLATAGTADAPNAFGSMTLAKIQATRPGGSAMAHVSLAGRPDTIPLRVYTEGGGWKIDLTRLLEAQAQELQKQLGVKPKASKDAIQSAIEKELFPIIAKRSGKPVSDKLWTPLASVNN